MAGRIDLHTHTTASDGTLTPRELLLKACEAGVQILALTDHDTTAGYQDALALPERPADMELIPAVEMSAEGEWSCHLLGYFIDPSNTSFQNKLTVYRDQRRERARTSVQKLKTLGIDLDFQDVLAQSRGTSVGRPHIADALREKGIVRNRQEAFDRFLKKDGPAFVPLESPTASEVIAIIRQAGGVPVLAHPSYYTSDSLIKELADIGLAGLEIYYPSHTRTWMERYKQIAGQYHLIVTGGSDFHGPRTGRDRLACVNVPEETVESLRQAARLNQSI